MGVKSFEDVYALVPILVINNFIHKPDNDNEQQVYFFVGDIDADIRTHHIHVVFHGGYDWNNYVRFRDFLNANESKALQYNKLKKYFEIQYPNDRQLYT